MTAVEWLKNELWEKFNFSFSDNIFEQAKVMEKQQLIDARDSGIYTALNRFNNELLKENHIVETNEMISYQIEISDEEIEKSISYDYKDPYVEGYINGAKWYREQLKKKQ